METGAIPPWAPGLLLLLLALPPVRAGTGPQNVLLLANQRSPDSIAMAEHYARARGLHPVNALLLDDPSDREISFSVYEDSLAGPVARYLERTSPGPQIDYIVATQGFPIRLVLPRGSPQRNLSLTAALQALGADLSVLPPTLAGRLNLYFGIHRAFSHEEALAGGKIKIRLATMLAGFTAAGAKGLVDNAIRAEESPPPRGLFLFQDARGNAKAPNEI